MINRPVLPVKSHGFGGLALQALMQRSLIRTKRPAPAPLPVTIEPSAPEPTPGAAADAAALLELAGGDAGTLAALRELLQQT